MELKHSLVQDFLKNLINPVIMRLCDVDILNSYFGYTIHNTRGKPTNSEFIAMISDRLRLHMKSAS
ncbi:sporulation initiation factor Spo0A C-terminal domain-containing protein [Caproiciproducens sp. CPB-2]|nr:sporulation initiation factor Spo0A C-terminal domain-containing protein [Caproiciproducens sp. CPB-2]